MFIVDKNDQVNAFKAVPLPSARKLFERYGFSLAKGGHPDNTDPYNFNAPSNLVGSTELEQMSRVGAAAVSAARAQQVVENRPEDLPSPDKPAEDAQPLE